MPTILDKARAFAPRPWHALNKRGQMLVVFGFIWAAIGWNILHTPDPAGWDQLPIIADVPRELRAAAWALTGATAVAFAWRPLMVAHDGFGFLALYVMPAERVCVFMWGWIDFHAPGFPIGPWVIFEGPGYQRGAYSVTVWIAVLAAVIVTATWDNPPAQVYRRDDGGTP